MGVSVRQAEKIATVVKAANVKVESYWPTLFAKLLEKRSVEDLILSVGSGIPPTSISCYYAYDCTMILIYLYNCLTASCYLQLCPINVIEPLNTCNMTIILF